MMKAAVLAVAFVLTGPGVADANGPGSDTVELTMSNFRYCAGASCTPADQGYLRTSAGPVAGADNPHGTIDVPEGSTVRWVYRDVGPGSCDSFDQCPGHNVRFEDGSAEGLSMGGARSRSGEATITATVNQSRGELIRYFCSINDHYQLGMTGILRVV
jgi:plastocyanin